jgi:Tfp pilus assembly protein FimV
MSAAYAVVVPTRVTPRRVYARRRLTVLLALFTTGALTIGVGQALANRGGAPASTPAVRPTPPGHDYVVQPGDTMWSIAAVAPHGDASQSEYVERLVDLNGGSSLAVGQLLLLP